MDTEHATLAEALVAALAELSDIATSRTADTGTFSYEYANIADVGRVARPKLAEHGIVYTQSIHDHEHGLAITTEFLHVSGETKAFGPLPFPRGSNPQQTGSAITYHRRYGLLAALGLATTDDDGAAASVPPPPPPAGKTVAQAKNGLVRFLKDHTDEPRDAAVEVWKRADLAVTQVGGKDFVSEDQLEELEAAHLVPSVHCSGRLDPHEPQRGADKYDADRVLTLCRQHHEWVHRNVDQSRELGLLVHRWEEWSWEGHWKGWGE